MRLALHAVAVVAAAALAASTLLLTRAGVAPGAAAAVALPPSLLLGFIGLASRYSCRAMPLRRTSTARIVVTHAGAAAAAGGVWVITWNEWLEATGTNVAADAPLLFGIAASLYAVTVMVHYLFLEIETAREAEEAALRFQVLAREAELRAFKAQVDPHFLFNSLNSVAALCQSRPDQAREMARLMADFFRMTLRLGAQPRITLGEEIDLVSRYLAIEKVRFGDRLSIRVETDDEARKCLIPPLLLQPLIENSVRHGIASLVGGGTVEMAATLQNGALRIVIENPVDPDREPSRGEGIGLQNATERLGVVSGGRARLSAGEANGHYRVEIELPA